MDSCNKEEDEYLINDSLIRYFFKENPDTLTDHEYVRRVKELEWLSNNGLLKNRMI